MAAEAKRIRQLETQNLKRCKEDLLSLCNAEQINERRINDCYKRLKETRDRLLRSHYIYCEKSHIDEENAAAAEWLDRQENVYKEGADKAEEVLSIIEETRTIPEMTPAVKIIMKKLNKGGF